MSLSILNNIPSLVAQNQLAVTNTKLQNTLFQLSSGSRINSGADDPAGLSIADGLQSNIMALTQSTQNVTNGVGMLQTADGALSQVTTLLNRAVTLATEAGNTGLTGAGQSASFAGQQQALQNEFTSITNEINQIGANTTYNNTQVFTSTPVSVFLSDGSNVDENNVGGSDTGSISVAMQALSASSLGLGTYATGTLDLQANPSANNTVTVGAQTYTFAASAGAANTVAIAGNVGQTLQNLMAAVNNGPNGTGAGTAYGTGTAANTSATVTSVNGGSATFQAITAGAITTIALNSFLTSAAGSSSANLNGGAAATSATGTLSFANQPSAITSASGKLTLTGAVTAGDTVSVGANTYTFVAAGTASTANSVSLDTNGSLTNDLNNLANAITGGAGNNPLSASAMTYYASDPVTAGVTASVTGSVMTITSTAAGTAGNATTAFAASISHSNGSVGGAVNAGQLGGGAAADTVNIGGTSYTFVAQGTATTANSVSLGNSVNQTLTNLATVVNSGANGAPANAEASVAVFGNSATITAAGSNVLYAGTLGNSVALASTAGTVSGANLANGAQATAASGKLTVLSNPVLGDTVAIGGTSYTFVASGNATAANQVAISTGGSASANLAATLANLKAAVNTTGSGDAAALANGTTFGVGTGQNTAANIGTVVAGVVTVTALTPTSANSYGNNLTIAANLSGGAGGAVGNGFLTGGTAAASLLTASGAQAALASITSAIATVASQRGAIGSGINQMNAAVQVMNNTSQNLTSSLSGVQDANIGQVVANMSKYQVLEQTGISALSQSNQQEQTVLKLLQ